jgi:hypothetical protein
MLDAMGDVVAQDFLLDPAQRRLCRCYLRHHVDAIAIVLHHSGEAADLAFNSFQSPQTRGLDLCAHSDHIPPWGI